MLLHKYHCYLLKDFSFYTRDVHTNNAAGPDDSSTHWKNLSSNHKFLYCYHFIDLLFEVTFIVYNYYSKVKTTKNSFFTPSIDLLFEHFATVIKVQIVQYY